MIPRLDAIAKQRLFQLLHHDIRTTLAIDPDNHSPITSKSRLASFRYALAGCLYMLRHQKNIRIQTLATILIAVVGLWLGLPAESWAILVVIVTLNLMAEFTNSAIEAVVNLVSPDHHPMARVAKDVAAGTSLLVACASVLVGLFLLGPPLITRISLLIAR
jgi:diacylglycerol kinase